MSIRAPELAAGACEGYKRRVSNTAFFVRSENGFVATPYTRGPWDMNAQHGGPPAALLARALECAGERASAFMVARLTFELLRPVPIGLLQVHVEPIKLGRTVERWRASLTANGVEVLQVTALRILRRTSGRSNLSDERWPAPETLPDLKLNFFRWDMGYHRGVELKLCHGTFGGTPIGVWARARIPLVAGEPITPLQSLLILADAQSGLGLPLDPSAFTFVNPDLTVYLERPPQGAWFGFDIRSTASGEGMGLSQSSVRDCEGVVARSAQSLVVATRPG